MGRHQVPKNKKRPKSWHRVSDGNRWRKAMRSGLQEGYRKIEKENRRRHKVWIFDPDGDPMFVAYPCACKIAAPHWNSGESL